LQVDVGFKNEVLMCYEGIANFLRIQNMWNPPTKVLQVMFKKWFAMWWGYYKPNTYIQGIWSSNSV
jgi:hypothetical protein